MTDKKTASKKKLPGAGPARSSGASPARSRGGQPGNKNAYRHGFYAKSIPADIAWDPPPSSGYDTLEPEMGALQVLMDRLSALLDTPDPDLKDPDAPFKTILSSSHRLDVLQKIHHRLQDNTREVQRWIQDSLAHEKIKHTHPTGLLTVKNLEELRMRLFPESALPLEKYLHPSTLERYRAVQAFHEQEDFLFGLNEEKEAEDELD